MAGLDEDVRRRREKTATLIRETSRVAADLQTRQSQLNALLIRIEREEREFDERQARS